MDWNTLPTRAATGQIQRYSGFRRDGIRADICRGKGCTMIPPPQPTVSSEAFRRGGRGLAERQIDRDEGSRVQPAMANVGEPGRVRILTVP